MKKTTDKGATILAIKFFCNNLQKEVEISAKVTKTFKYADLDERVAEVDSFSWGGSESECEICGSHGEVHMSFVNACECGMYHSIELSSW